MNMSIGWPNNTSGGIKPIPNLSLYVEPTTNIDIPPFTEGTEDGDFTIEWFARMNSDDNHPRAWSIGNYYDIGGAKAAVSIENGTFYFWVNGSIILSKNIDSYLQRWTWFMLQRFKSSVILYINGNFVEQAAFTGSITSNGKPLYIASEGVESLQNGLMSNFRWTVGTTAYSPPEETNYPVPISDLNNISAYTKLLCLQGTDLYHELLDASNFNNTLVNGTGIYNSDNPFYPGNEGSLQFGTI